ncbi:MAG TPA: hypothetical protein P5244_08940 [Syntrophales bacterium]|nr:hypothetical protein [Syntrophales bacterium]
MNERVNHRAASIVQSLETKAQRKALSLSAKLTPSLIFAGLVRGIIPTWMQKKSNQLTPDFATFKPNGEANIGQNASARMFTLPKWTGFPCPRV